MDLKKLRNKIDKIDKKIIKFLEKRINLVRKIAILKDKNKLPLTDYKRESEILNNLKNFSKDKLLKEFIPLIYQNIFDLSKAYRILNREKEIPFSKIGIIGLGIIGGSLVKTLKTKNKNIKIFSLKRNDEDVKLAFQEGYLDGVFDIKELSQNCDLIILATPISFIIPLAREIKKAKKKNNKLIVIDVGSVKEKIVKEFERLTNDNLEFLGTHPMAGSDKSGFKYSSSFLFLNYPWIITPHKRNKKETIQKIKKFIYYLGSKPLILSAEKHDKITAKVSHLIFLISTLLFAYVYETDRNSIKYSGRGFETTTRLTSGNPYMHFLITSLNKENIKQEFKNFIKFLSRFEIKEKNLLKFFVKYKRLRDKIIKK